MERNQQLDSGHIYSVTQLVTALTTAANEVFSLVASSLSKVDILEVSLSQLSSGGVTNATVELFRGTSAAVGGSTANPLTPVNRAGHAAAAASTCTVNGASTTPNSTANCVRFEAGAFGMASGQYRYRPEFPENLNITQRLQVRITPLTTAILTGLSATLTYREVGKSPQQ